MNRNFFEFDLNKCVGCHACIVACSNENNLDINVLWREITTFNEFRYPQIPVFFYSLACNHCGDPLCLINCPAKAYSVNPQSQAVIHHAEKCIGCKYCTWACPYDAPKYNPAKSIVEKCSFCSSRIEQGKKPACTNLCPTGALSFQQADIELINKDIEGFIDFGINPSINIIPLRANNRMPEYSEEKPENNSMPKEKIKSKINLKKDWTLVAFTLIISILTGLICSSIFEPLLINRYIFAAMAISSLGLSILHLGKKTKAWRAILNFKESWLSREIFFYLLFIAFSFLSIFVFPNNKIITIIASTLGFITLISIDMVYSVTLKPSNIEMHSAHTILTGILLFSLFLKNFIIFSIIIAIKVGLYIYRKWYFYNNKNETSYMATAWRLTLLVSFPLIIWFINPLDVFWYITALILVSEIIDRCEYYIELEIITPKKKLKNDFEELEN